AMLAEASRPVMGTTTGFDTNQYWRQLGNKRHESLACQPLAPQNLAGGVRPHQVKNFFGQIDGNGAQFVLHGTRPPRGYFMISFADLSVADHCRSAQGRVHFINALAGHASLQTTQRYIDGDSEAKRKLVQ